MKKRILSIILCVAMSYSLCACGSEKSEEDIVSVESSEIVEDSEKTEMKEEATFVELGDTISTDILEITIDSAELAFFASSVNDNTYATPVESTNGIFTTNKGHVFVCLKFGVKNTDRAKVSLGDNFGGIPFEFYYLTDEVELPLMQFDLNNPDGSGLMNFAFAVIGTDKDSKLTKAGSSNKLVEANEYLYVQTLGIVNTEPQNLTDSFQLKIYLPNSSGEKEVFIYNVQ